MFKKIRSNIDPDATVAKELRKEFGKYFDKAEGEMNGLVKAYPRQIFIGMLVFIVISAIVCFIVLTPERQTKKMDLSDVFKGTTEVANTVRSGIDKIEESKTKAKDIYELQKQVELVLSKNKLTKEDSVFLEKAIPVLDRNSNLLKEKR